VIPDLEVCQDKWVLKETKVHLENKVKLANKDHKVHQEILVKPDHVENKEYVEFLDLVDHEVYLVLWARMVSMVNLVLLVSTYPVTKVIKVFTEPKALWEKEDLAVTMVKMVKTELKEHLATSVHVVSLELQENQVLKDFKVLLVLLKQELQESKVKSAYQV